MREDLGGPDVLELTSDSVDVVPLPGPGRTLFLRRPDDATWAAFHVRACVACATAARALALAGRSRPCATRKGSACAKVTTRQSSRTRCRSAMRRSREGESGACDTGLPVFHGPVAPWRACVDGRSRLPIIPPASGSITPPFSRRRRVAPPRASSSR